VFRPDPGGGAVRGRTHEGAQPHPAGCHEVQEGHRQGERPTATFGFVCVCCLCGFLCSWKQRYDVPLEEEEEEEEEEGGGERERECVCLCVCVWGGGGLCECALNMALTWNETQRRGNPFF